MPPKRKMSGWAKLGIVLAAIFLLFVGCVAVVANIASDTPIEEDSPSISDGVKSDDTVGDISQGVGSQDASGDVQLGTARNTDYDLSTVLPVKVTNNSAKRSDYTIEIAADRPDGSRITTGWAHVRQLEPGQTTEVEAQFWADSVTVIPSRCHPTRYSRFFRCSARRHYKRFSGPILVGWALGGS
jgi:hypothetical protein